jgi:SAM-dependent methyltransferase
MSKPAPGTAGSSPNVEEFLGEPTRNLDRWLWLWEGDLAFPIRSHRGGLAGRVVVFLKRLLRPLVKAPLADAWDRQRAYNLVTVEYLKSLDQARQDLLRDLREVRNDLLRDVQNNHRRISHLEAFKREGFGDVMRHSDALYAVVDQKLDRYRRESQQLWARLGSLLARVERPGGEALSSPLADGLEEQDYVALEDRFRGTRSEIVERVEVYVTYLPASGEVLDLGCGRGETLSVLRERGWRARGVDASREMVDHCRQQGLEAETGDLFEALALAPEGSLAGVISLHVIEHLPGERLGRLVRLAWRVLEPGGALILETPNPLSLVVAARNFWRDPTHRRPVHPATLALLFEQAGFDPVERLELRPFSEGERLPDMPLAGLPSEVSALAERMNDLRDRLDELLFGCQDYAMIGIKPA